MNITVFLLSLTPAKHCITGYLRLFPIGHGTVTLRKSITQAGSLA